MTLYNIESEQSILGAILLEPEAISQSTVVNLNAQDFYIPKHSLIYKFMKKLYDEKIPTDVMTVSNELKKYDKLDQVGGIAYLISLTTIVPTTDNIIYYMKIVKELAIKRDLEDLLRQSTKAVQIMDSKDFLKLSDDLKLTIMNKGDVDDLFIDASTIYQEKDDTGAIQTGFSILDSCTGGGLKFGTMTILTGTPGSGKSTFLNQILANAMSLGYNAFLYSGELTYQMMMEWLSKTIANPKHLGTFTNNFGKYIKISDEGYDMIRSWTKDKLFFFSKNAKADETNLANVIEFLAVKKDVKLFILDNLMTLECSGSDKYEKQIIATKALKNLAKKYNLVIILVAHSNKSSIINRDSHVFEISGASEIPNLADYVFKAARDDAQNITNILILKNRITGIIKRKAKLTFDSSRKRFYTEGERELKKDFGYEPTWEQQSFDTLTT